MSTWTTPITFVAGNSLSAAQLNAEVRDHVTFLKGALDLITNSTTADTGTATLLGIVRTASSDTILQGKVSGDAQQRLAVDASGSMFWGSGAASADVKMRRISAGQPSFSSNGASVDTRLISEGTAGFVAGIGCYISGESTPRILLEADNTGLGRISFGDGSTRDTDLFRSAANTLKTNDHFIAADGLQTKTVAGVVSDGSFTVTPASGAIAIDTTNSRIYVRVGATWKFVAVA